MSWRALALDRPVVPALPRRPDRPPMLMANDWPKAKRGHDFSLTRIFRDTRWPHHGASPLSEGGERNGDDQGRTVEERLDEEGPAELLDAGNANGKDQHAEYRAP